MYSETEGTISDKEKQIKKLQQEESQALANDNYDLAEEISSRLEQLKIDLEFSRYRLPAQDEKVLDNTLLLQMLECCRVF